MKTVSTDYKNNDFIHIRGFGREDDSSAAHWGKGSRDVFIVHYVIDGEGYFNGVCVRKMQGFLIYPDMIHEYYSSSRNPWRYVWFTLTGNMVKSLLDKYLNPNTDGVFEYGFQKGIEQVYDNILKEKFLGEAKSLSYFWHIMSMHEDNTAPLSNGYVKEARIYMENNFHRNVSVTEVAAHLRISDRYLYNLFVKHEKISPKQYLNKLRLDRARSMLCESDLPVSYVAMSVGFSDVLAFSKFFKINMNVSPSAYRKSLVGE